MKHTYTLLSFLLFSLSAFCQSADFTLTFEDATVINHVYYTDSLLDPIGIWQIGRPNKQLLNSAYLSPNAVVTGLDSVLPANVNASFIITLPDVHISISGGGILTFIHKYNFDTLHSGGYVEYSVDTGRHWHDVLDVSHKQSCVNFNPVTVDGQFISAPTWWDSISRMKTSDSISYFPGTNTTWIYDTIGFAPTVFFVKTDVQTEYMFRFTVFSDSLSSGAEGWMLDNIRFQNYVIGCGGGGINEINSSHLSINPNPAQGIFTISLSDEINSDHIAALYDLTGREMMQKDFNGSQVTMQRSGLAAGSYIVKVTNARTQDTFEKRVVFE